jgi:acetyltransferase-like isoleucine patch superfamily enzyme
MLGVLGGNFGREVAPLARAQYPDHEVVLVPREVEAAEINGCRVMTFERFSEETGGDASFCVAIGDAALRRKVTEECVAGGMTPVEIRASNVFEMDEVRIGSGAILSPFVTLLSNARIGRGFHANIYSYFAHDCVIGDYVTFAPRVSCNGHVHVEDGAYVGTGACLRQGRNDAPLTIGAYITS